MIDRDELAAWLRLLETPGVGRESARRLLAAFGSPDAVLSASSAARQGVVTKSVAAALAKPPETLDALIDATFNWLRGSAELIDGGAADVGERAPVASSSNATGQHQRDVIALGDARYPPALLNTADPPLLFYVQGRVEMLNTDSLSIVGSRNPTPQGAENARQFARDLSLAGWTIVSGLALGIDGAAHEGGLEGWARGGSSSIAVVGTGLDRVYPKRHRNLAHRLASSGLLLSEFSLGTPAIAANFLLRNRIIAGLSRGTLVVEAALQSGSLITARLASEAGRDVFAIPGSIHSQLSRGCHALIRQGAQLVDSVQRILEELQPAASRPASPTLPLDPQAAAPHPLIEALGHDPVSLDALIARTGWPASKLNARLLELELDGVVARLPGQLFQRVVRI